MSEEQTAEQRHRAFTQRYYSNANPRFDAATLTSAYGDAAHMCDAVAADIACEMRSTKRAREIAYAIKRAGDAIWQMRELVR